MTALWIAAAVCTALAAWVTVSLIVAPRIGRRLRRNQPPPEVPRGDR